MAETNIPIVVGSGAAMSITCNVLRNTNVRFGLGLSPWQQAVCHCESNNDSAYCHRSSTRNRSLLYRGHNPADGTPGLAMPVFVPLAKRADTLAHLSDRLRGNRPQRLQHQTPLVRVPVRTIGKPEPAPERKSTPQAKIRISFFASRKPSCQRFARCRSKRHGDDGD